MLIRDHIKYVIALFATVNTIYSSTMISPDEKNLYLVRTISQFSEEIRQHKSKLNTSSEGLSLLSLAVDRMQNIGILPTDPSWELVAAYILQRRGTDKIPFSAKSPFNKIIAFANCLSACRLETQGISENYDDLDTKGFTSEEASQYKQLLDQSYKAITPEFREETSRYLAHLSYLRSTTVTNCWHLNETFWSQAGVISPCTVTSLQALYNPQIAPLDFLADLSNKLSAQLNSITAASTSTQKTKAIIDLSRQILFTITAGIPTHHESFTPLSPKNENDWELIRKAIFLALSACDMRDNDITHFLSPVYDLGKYYPTPSTSQEVKEYFWKIETYAELYAKISRAIKIKSNESLSQISTGIIEESDYFKQHRESTQKLGIQSQLTFKSGQEAQKRRKIFESLINTSSMQSWKTEIEGLLSAATHINYCQSFQDLYAHLTHWINYHNASEQIPQNLLSTYTILGNTPPQTNTLEITLQNGKWVLKSAQSTEILWQQSTDTSESFHGKLNDKRGSHFFSFEVIPQSLTIHAISTGYKVKLGHETAHVSVTESKSLGIVESSAYQSSTLSIPTDEDISKKPNSIINIINGTSRAQDSAIQIISKTFNGSHGLLIARRGSVWIEATDSITLANESQPQTLIHNGRPYNFFKNEGNGIEALKDISLFSPDTNLKFSKLIAGGNIALRETPLPTYIAPNHQYLQTSGSYIHAGLALDIDCTTWHGDTQTVFAGNVEQESYLAFNSAQANLNYRYLRYMVWNLCFYDDAEKNLLSHTTNSHGAFHSFVSCKPNFATQIIFRPTQTTIISSAWTYRPFNH